jgi:hypothetical protein
LDEKLGLYLLPNTKMKLKLNKELNVKTEIRGELDKIKEKSKDKINICTHQCILNPQQL